MIILEVNFKDKNMTKIILSVVLVRMYLKTSFHLNRDEIWSNVDDLIVTHGTSCVIHSYFREPTLMDWDHNSIEKIYETHLFG